MNSAFNNFLIRCPLRAEDLDKIVDEIEEKISILKLKPSMDISALLGLVMKTTDRETISKPIIMMVKLVKEINTKALDEIFLL